MAGIQDLIAMAQGGPESATSAPRGQANMGGYLGANGAPNQMLDPIAALQALVGNVGGRGMTPQGGMAPNPMVDAIKAAMGSPRISSGDPMLDRMATAQAGDPRMQAVRGGGRPENLGAIGYGAIGPGGDGDLLDMAEANQSVRGSLPKEYMGMDTTGFTDDMAPMKDKRQTPVPSTEEELADVQRKMGGENGPPSRSGDPAENGDFPSQQEIRDLLGGYTSEEEFDAKWGNGAAQELYPDRGPGNGPPGQKLMGDYLKKGRSSDDDGDHEYR